VILGSTSYFCEKNSRKNHRSSIQRTKEFNEGLDDNGNIPESFYTNGGLKLRVVWTIRSLIIASARNYLLQNIISDHPTL